MDTTQLEDVMTCLIASLPNVELDAAAPACPGWSHRDVVVHLGGVHEWCRGALVDKHGRTPTPTPPLQSDDADADVGELSAWYAVHAQALLDAMQDIDGDEPCWTFAEPHSARFWLRRQLHETIVHLVDVDPEWNVRADVAIDGIDEVVHTMFPRQVRLGRAQPVERALAIAPVEGRRFVMFGDGHGAPLDDTDAHATIAGPASLLYLTLWGRISLQHPGLIVTGDRAVAEAVLGAHIVP